MPFRSAGLILRPPATTHGTATELSMRGFMAMRMRWALAVGAAVVTVQAGCGRQAAQRTSAGSGVASSSTTASTSGSVALTAADSALVGRILLAEDRRDSADRALGEGRAHSNPLLRMLAMRATGRIRDPKFAARDSLAALPAPPVWAEPEWKARFRGL